MPLRSISRQLGPFDLATATNTNFSDGPSRVGLDQGDRLTHVAAAMGAASQGPVEVGLLFVSEGVFSLIEEMSGFIESGGITGGIGKVVNLLAGKNSFLFLAARNDTGSTVQLIVRYIVEREEGVA